MSHYDNNERFNEMDYNNSEYEYTIMLYTSLLQA